MSDQVCFKPRPFEAAFLQPGTGYGVFTAEELAKKYDCRFVDNETPYERVEKGHPTIVDYFYHEEVRGTANSGKRNVIHNP